MKKYEKRNNSHEEFRGNDIFPTINMVHSSS